MRSQLSWSKNFRLTSRGVLVIRLLLACVALAGLALIWGVVGMQHPIAPAIAAENPQSDSYQQIVVQPGDTLWEISSRLAQGHDRARILEQIMTYNNLETSDLDVGQTLFVPYQQHR